MNLLVRLIRVLLTSRARGVLAPLGESVVPFRVWPFDVDLNLHMNNGRYLSLMDLGRLDLIIRVGLMREVRRRRWMPLVGSATIRYRRSLAPFQRYHLHTRIVGWDEKWFFIEQRFVSRGELVAVGFIKGLFRAPGGNVAPAQILSAVGHPGPSPDLPIGVVAWQQAERRLAEQTA